jgi:hypothetical protein
MQRQPVVNNGDSDEFVVNTNQLKENKKKNKTGVLLLKSSNTKQIEEGLELLSVALHA